MSQFENVTVIKKASVYFDGQVTSRTILFADGTRKTLGVMMPGVYEFATEKAERMEMLSGNVEVRLPNEASWQSIPEGGCFDIPAHSTFSIKVKKGIADYCCSYFD